MGKKVLLYTILTLSYLFYHTILFGVVEEFILTHDFPFVVQFIFIVLYLIGVSTNILIDIETIFGKGDKHD